MQVERPVQTFLRYPVPLRVLDPQFRIFYRRGNHQNRGHEVIRRILIAYSSYLQPWSFQLNPVLGKKMAWDSRNRITLAATVLSFIIILDCKTMIYVGFVG
jgi:hypothetical protein